MFYEHIKNERKLSEVEPTPSPKRSCPEIPFFGAPYPDATCIDGFLWDLDSCEGEEGFLTQGGETPCPFCNTKAFLQVYADRQGITKKEWLKEIERLRAKYS